jgi:hypothetical protein
MRNLGSVALFVLLIGSSGFAASSTYSSGEYTSPVPQSSIPIEDLRKADTTPNLGWEFLASSWSPTNLKTESYLTNTSKATANIPQLSLNLDQALTWLGDSPFKLASKFGFSYLGMQRSADFFETDANVGASQDINLYTLRVGLQVTRPTNFLAGHLTPFLGVAYVPTWVVASSSVFNNGTNDLDSAFEFTGGASCGVPPVSRFLNVEQFSLELGIQGTIGVGSSLSGVGVFGGTRIQI